MSIYATSESDSTSRLPPEHVHGIKQVQVGCGPHHLRPAWWNTDLRKFEGIDEAMDATIPWRWDGILNYVFAEHFIEHLALEGAAKFLASAGSALRLGGRLRLSTPSLEWVIKTHFTFESKDLSSRLSDTFAINRAFHGWGHRFLYSKEMLHEMLMQVGFEKVVYCKYGESEIPELRGLEMHPGGSAFEGYDDVLVFEATRGERKPTVSIWLDSWIRNSYSRWANAEH